ncbi:peptidylprolyl isomerase [Gloeobacter morelensis]|uniref:Peptidyl-prolyl cis-trans isomerase n=1 Tax=Gloeobacter morelensis MG652769 TaxID=2781736 RepID=A0ABY3PJ31_9CYAN|nr:peptidylprolyl isomerase [Gloeobacter morelensis]UFP93676.1 peptidylprolyl isomerase [Gloeobacter morelensis MG652769]
MQRIRWLAGALAVIAFVLATTACTQAGLPPADPQENPTVNNPSGARADLPSLAGKATVELNTSKGRILLEVDGDNAPLSAGNFVDLVKRGFYNNLAFHRVVSGFVIQGGDPLGNGTGGFIDPATRQPRSLPLEIRATTGDGQPGEILYGQTFSLSGRNPRTQPPVLVHSRGALAMARSQNPNSASSQFYITLAETRQLDGEYAVFGKVLEGQDVVDKIQVGDKIVSATVVSGGNPATGSAPG